LPAIRRAIPAQEGDSADIGFLRLIVMRLRMSRLAVLRLRAVRLPPMRLLAAGLSVMRLLARAVAITPLLPLAVSVAIVTAGRSLGDGRLGALRMRAPIGHRQRYADELFDVAQERHFLGVA
jgi:hypothetical protein